VQIFKRVYLGLGANLGDPVQQIIDARVKLISLKCVHAWTCSSMYLSSPVGYADQANFINCVLALDIDNELIAEEFFAHVQKIETDLGRVRDSGNQNAPRKIDIDVLLFADQVINLKKLLIPHPRMAQRLFVIEPLNELGVDIKKDKNTDFSQQEIFKLAI